MSDVERAEKVLAELMDRRDACVARAGQLGEERRRLAYAAHAVGGDKTAQARLRKVNDETVLHNLELEGIDAAIAEATARVATAKQVEAAALDRQQAEALREKLAKFIELGGQVDDCLWDLAQSINAMIPLLHEMHQLGQESPTSEQFRINFTMAIKSMLQELPQVWVRDFEFQRLSPNQKKRAAEVCAGWQTMIASQIAARLGEPDGDNITIKSKEVVDA
jgi:hypothetical protein